MGVRIPIVDRRSSREPEAAPRAATDPGEGLNAEAAGQSVPPPEVLRDARAASPAADAGPGGGDLARLAQERDEWRDRCLRVTAELENVRRLTEQRVEAETFRRERERLERWLELGDALDRARALAATAPAEWRRGLEEIARLFDDRMAKSGARRFTGEGTFDPAIHEAVSAIAVPGRPDGAVVETIRAGWMLGERLLRPAGVVVARGAAG